jgi:4-hydroxy-tetrahydrodipicolinate reductase
MKISLVGYGRMGHLLHKVAEEQGHEIISIIDPNSSEATHKEITEGSLRNTEVVIDFSSPEAVLENVKKVASFKKNIVVGTTGWYENLEEIKKVVEKSGIGFIFSPNFSLGVNAFFKITRNVARIFNKLKDYDVYGIEYHHSRKKDSPSGTAKKLGEIVLEEIDRKKELQVEKLDRPIKKEELHFASVRGGEFPGTHEIGFDSEADTIKLVHIARSRKGFALGALKAAEFIRDKKGFYTIEDLVKEIGI